VTYIDYDGREIASYNVEYGDKAPIPSSPEREGYTFEGWTQVAQSVTQDLEFSAIYNIGIYTLSYLDIDGSIFASYQVEYGAEVPIPSAPSKVGYTFEGWSEIPSIITEDIEIQAIFKEIAYEVNYVDFDGTILATYQVKLGDEAPNQPHPKRNAYTFERWSEAPTFITEDINIQAIYSKNYSSLDHCQIKTIARHSNNIRTGFPYESYVTKDSGKVRIAVIALDFPNFEGNPDVLEGLKNDVLRAEDWSRFMTNGDMIYEIEFVNQWVRLPYGPDYYPSYGNAYSADKQPYQDAINQVFNAADPYIDFTNIDFVYFIFPYESLLVRPTVLYGRINVVTERAGRIQMAIYGNENVNSYEQNSFWSHMVHEVLHFQGFVGHGPCHHCEIGIMTRDNGASKAILTWEGFLANWYDEDDVYCYTKEDIGTGIEYQLDSLDKLGGSPGFKNMMIPLSDHEIMIIEYRTNGPYSTLPREQQGILIYVVDTSKKSNYPSPEWVSKNTDPDTYWFTLLNEYNWHKFAKGQSVEYKDILIEIIESQTVRVSLKTE
jgi:hypothetical protein